MSSDPIAHAELLLKDPGLVENSSDAEHCVHACFQMIFRSRIGDSVPSFAELDVLMDKEPGKYTYEYALLADMPKRGFETRLIWQIDLAELIHDPASYFLKYYGQDTGTIFIENSNLASVQKAAQRLLDSDVSIELRCPEPSDIVRLLNDGFYLTMTVNQRVLQADPGYVAHSILVYGASKRGLRIHNPGPPSTAASEITWDMFDKAWSDPDQTARNIMAMRPLGEVSQR